MSSSDITILLSYPPLILKDQGEDFKLYA